MPSQPFIQALSIRNFRGLRSLTIDPLRRITLLGGLNGVGKSTVLDAIFQLMDSNNPLVLLRSAQIRQTPTSLASIHRINEGHNPENPGFHSFKTRVGKFDATWQWGIQDMGDISTTAVNTNSLKSPAQSNQKQLGYSQSLTLNGAPIGLRRYAGDESESFLFKQEISHAIQFPPTNYLTRMTIFASTDLANKYSSVVQQGLKNRFLQAINSLSREFEDIEILQISGQPVLHLTLNGVMMPLSFAGDGVSSIAAIVLSIMIARGGIVLIDEFDASVHYSKLEDTWRLIHKLCLEFDCQVVAATHSRENVLSLFSSVDENYQNDAIFYRLDYVNNTNVATCYNWIDMREANSEGWEFR